MSTMLPEYYFRIRENGALVFRVDTENRQRRIELEQIAVINMKKGEVRAHGGRELSAAERAAIDEWMERRRAVLEGRRRDLVAETVERLNLTTQWIGTEASESEIEAAADQLLLAMHDLRSVIVRKRSRPG